jgi:hypothetical protein
MLLAHVVAQPPAAAEMAALKKNNEKQASYTCYYSCRCDHMANR